MNSTEKLLNIKKQIDEAKNKQAEIKGKKEAIEKQIKDKFNIEITEVQKTLDDMANELDEMEENFKDGLEKLEDAYEWN